MSFAPGDRLGPYEILESAGSGGMGVVFRARDTRLDRIVAIKVLPDLYATDAQFRDRFQREARAIASLSHPHICMLHDIGEQDGRAFLVLEFLAGETLAARLQRERIPYYTLLTWSLQLCEGLDCAHQKGILHRDLKPANLFITSAGSVKILDFGLAKRTDDSIDAGVPPKTQAGTAVGTVAYMSPEQARAAISFHWVPCSTRRPRGSRRSAAEPAARCSTRSSTAPFRGAVFPHRFRPVLRPSSSGCSPSVPSTGTRVRRM
jgi:serine/threonine protein kinase